MNKNECKEKCVLLEMKGVQWRDKQGCSSKTGGHGIDAEFGQNGAHCAPVLDDYTIIGFGMSVWWLF